MYFNDKDGLFVFFFGKRKSRKDAIIKIKCKNLSKRTALVIIICAYKQKNLKTLFEKSRRCRCVFVAPETIFPPHT